MALASLDAWTQLLEVNEDISAVVGSSGLVDVSRGVEAAHAMYRPPVPDASFFLVASEGRPSAGKPQQQVSALLGALAEDSVSSSPENLDIVATLTSRTGEHLVAQQTVRGHEVVGARIAIHEDEGRPYCLTGSPLGDLETRDPGEQPKTTEQDAEHEVRSILKLDDSQPVGVRRVVFPLRNGAIWAFAVNAVLQEPVADVRVYLRADDLKVIVRHNVAAAEAVPGPPAPLTGRGRAYAVNPLRTPNLMDVVLEGIGPVPPNLLAGPRVKVEPRIPPPVSNNLREFMLGDQDPGFDEVQGFYHLGQAFAYYANLLAGRLTDAPPFAPVTAVVRDPASPDNAFFIPDTGQLWFGDFGDRPSARSAEIVYHELGHAVSDSLARLGRGFIPNSQARGMSEGYSDYFACSALDDPRVGDYVLNDPDGARNIARPGLTFPVSYVGEEHVTGEVWASLLWEIRGQCGQAVADSLALESIHFLDRNSTFVDGLAALRTAATRLYPNGQGPCDLGTVIDEAFDARRPAR